HPADSDRRMPAFPGCRHSLLSVDFHRWPESKGQAWTPHSETVDLPRSALVPPPLLPPAFCCFHFRFQFHLHCHPLAELNSSPLVGEPLAAKPPEARESLEREKSPRMGELAALPLAGLAYDLSRKRLPPVRQPRLAPARMRSIAIAEKLGLRQKQQPAGRTRNHESPNRRSVLRPSIPPQFAPTPWAQVLQLPPVVAPRSRSA